jgi:hypothetical protein
MRILRQFLARVKNFAMGQRSREFGIRIAVERYVTTLCPLCSIRVWS